jgi:hypothetical protein
MFINIEDWNMAEKWFIVSVSKNYSVKEQADVMIRASPVHEDEVYTEICLRFLDRADGSIDFAFATAVAFTDSFRIPPKLFSCDIEDIDACIAERNDELRERSEPTLPLFAGNVVADAAFSDIEKNIVSRLLGALNDAAANPSADTTD